MHARITEADIERMKRGFALYNEQSFDALREFMSPDVVVERAGDLPPLHGWEAVRQLLEPDAFAWQRMHPLDWTINGDKALVHVRLQAQGATSGIELDMEGWLVWTVRDSLVIRMQSFTEEQPARDAAGLGQAAST